MRRPELIAHRGYALRYPENTLAAVDAAIAAGARHVEIDVQTSSDGVPFLMHDRTLERMCGVAGSIAQRTAREIALLRASEPGRFGAEFAGEPVASLAAFVDRISRAAGVRAFVELKRAALDAFGVDVVLDGVVGAVAPIAERCTLISFDPGVLHAARERTRLALGTVLIDWGQREHESVRALKPEFVFCDLDKLPASGALAVPGSRLAVYEVADPALALQLAERGVDLVETFAIAEMLRALEPA